MKSFSWKTTLFGALSAIGLFLSQDASAPAWLHTVGQLVGSISTGLMGFFARDNNKSSEDVGAR